MSMWLDRYRSCDDGMLPEVTLDATSLFAKHGFRDDDVLWEWIEAVDAADYDIFNYFRNIRGNAGLTAARARVWSPDHHATLCDLVREHLFPLIPCEFTTYVTDSHNPIRIATWRGREFNYFREDVPTEVIDIVVTLPGTTVLAALTATTIADRDGNA